MMQAAEAWAAMRALPLRSYEAELGDAPVLVLAPHPDDESLGCGGLIAEACARGRPPVVVILTDGAASHPKSRLYPSDRLRALREQEALDATGILGLPAERLIFLRYPDSALPNEGAGLNGAATRIGDLVRVHGCRTLAVTWRHDPHCDHEAAAAIAAAVCRERNLRLLAYPIWGWTLPPKQVLAQAPMRGFRLDTRANLARKRAAIFAHASQYAGLITDDAEGFQLPQDFIKRFLEPTETFIDTDVGA